MTRITGLSLVFLAAGAALFLFYVKTEVLEIEADLRNAQRTILEHQEAVQVLQAEWSYLNRPERIAELAARHLGLQPVPPERIVRLDNLPPRAEAPAGKIAADTRATDLTGAWSMATEEVR